MFTSDFKIIEKISSEILFLSKINLKTIQKVFRSIIEIQKHGDGKYIYWL